MSLWNQVPHIDATIPHFLQANMLQPMSDIIVDYIAKPDIWMSKLTYKYDVQLCNDTCVLNYLINTTFDNNMSNI